MDGGQEDVAIESVLSDGGVEVTKGHEMEKKGTGHDQRDMVRMGKLQETRVRRPPPR